MSEALLVVCQDRVENELSKDESLVETPVIGKQRVIIVLRKALELVNILINRQVYTLCVCSMAVPRRQTNMTIRLR